MSIFQLRYYDSQEDSHCKGYIDLAEVQSVTPLKNVQGAPKKAEDSAFFEVRRFVKMALKTFNTKLAVGGLGLLRFWCLFLPNKGQTML